MLVIFDITKFHTAGDSLMSGVEKEINDTGQNILAASFCGA